ncbi:GFA family protein [Candidatus Raskinella chloraquaticus]|uniref:Aldehyde-activating protein n=1 Tax=Candidatus Raskinella chloraquaticus TaxID=1951219 RepID=A0A1W9HX61_9HYPH|nr:MAG: aldehyde-activating protein [Proteobacteria bacterium SG_bin8]
MTPPLTGGCQCGAVRFACDSLGRASICHCRMCQKAFGGYFGPLVTAHGLRWTRGRLKHWQSSQEVRRGFCNNCGTPLTFEPEGGGVDVAIGAFDEAHAITPEIQLAREARLPSFDRLHTLPLLDDADGRIAARFARITSNQHPDHDTPRWTIKS